MGAVYKAEDTRLGNRKVAVKEMSQSGLSPQEVIEAADAFKQEAFILAGLQHPNLPNIYDHFSEAGRWYLVMSFIQGETLEDYLNNAKGRKLSVEEVLQIGLQLCTVLDYLHTQQPPIIFRDLKPSNIMRTKDGHFYLIDFGIARHFKPGQAKDTAAYGSMGYASPEQYGKAQTASRSDIYSLGAVLHQMLSGHEPSTTPFRLPSLQLQVPTIPRELATLIAQMLELDENKRPASMSVVKQKLQSIAAALSGQRLPTGVGKSSISTTVAVGTPPISPEVLSPASTRKKNHRLAVLVSLLVVVISVSGIGFFAASHQASPNNNPGQTQPNNSTVQPETPTSPPSTSYPRLAPAYHGSVDNTTVGGTATLDLTSIVENQQVISGNVVIGSGLNGSGPFTGTITSDGSVTFTDIPSDGSPTIIFSGSLHPDGSLGGTYSAPSVNQQGTRQTTPSS